MTGNREQSTSRRARRGISRRHAGALFLLLAASVLLPACAAEPMAPTPTAVPLAATATPRPQPTGAPVTATPPEPAPEVTTEGATADGDRPAALSAIDEVLVRSTVEDLLARVVRGEPETAAQLYLTEEAKDAGLDAVLRELADGDPPPAEATLLVLDPVPPERYLVEAALRPQGAEEATHRVTLQLVYRRGLWLVDGVSVDDAPVDHGAGDATPDNAAPTATQAPAAGRSSDSATAGSALAGRIAFQTTSGGDIYVVDADGSRLRRVTDGLDPAWSPEGDQIAFTRWRAPWGVYVVRPDGSREQRIVDGNLFKEAAWAPGGRRLAFTMNQVLTDPQEVCFLGYCVTIPAETLAQMWVADLDSGALEILPLDDRVAHSPTWDPSGRRIVYAGERGLSWIDLDITPDGVVTDVQTGWFATSSGWDSSPAYSPDGKRIVFMGRVHNRWEILMVNADGSGRRQLTQSDPDLAEPPHNVAPAWSPDGQRIAFLSNRDGRWRIYVMSAGGTKQRPMFSGAADEVPIAYDWASERVISWGPAP